MTQLATLPLECVEGILEFLNERSLVQLADALKSLGMVTLAWREGIHQRCRKFLRSVPRDIVTEGLHLQRKLDYIELLRLTSTFFSDRSLEKYFHQNTTKEIKKSSYFKGPWDEHQHSHAMIRSTFAVNGSLIYSGDNEGIVEVHQICPTDKSDTDEVKLLGSIKINDGMIFELECMPCLDLICVAGQSSLHFLKSSMNGELVRLHEYIPNISSNKHLSVLGNYISYSTVSEKGTKIVVSKVNVLKTTFQLDISTVCEINTEERCLQWKLWENRIIVLMNSGRIVCYQLPSDDLVGGETDKVELLYSSDPCMMIAYKNPCWMLRDIVMCSSLATAGLFVRTNYWLMGWTLEETKRLFHALEQDKINPQDEIWCASIRLGLLLYGTESGHLMLFQTDFRESQSGKEWLIIPNRLLLSDNQEWRESSEKVLCASHSKVRLQFERTFRPIWKQRVSSKPILCVEIGLEKDDLILYYRCSMEEIYAIRLTRFIN